LLSRNGARQRPDISHGKIMKKLAFTIIASTAIIAAAIPAQARDSKVMLPIAAAMETSDAKAKLDGSVKFFFGDQPTPKVLKVLGTDKTSNRTNAFGKSDEKHATRCF
jgi:hypothetical protein